MSNANSILNDLIEMINKVNDEYNYYKSELGKLDRMRSDILHLIESKDNMNVVQGYKYSKALQLICKERRSVKNNLSAITHLMHKTKLDNNSIKNTAEHCISILNEKNEISNKGIESYTSRIVDVVNSDVLESVKDILNK